MKQHKQITSETMTDTCKTIRIIDKAKTMNDVEQIEFWLSLSESDKSLFDNLSDFLMATQVSLIH